jgi:hypothetical protein
LYGPTILLFVRCDDPAQVSHHERAKRRSLLRLTKYTDALPIWDNILGHETRRYILHLGPKTEPLLAIPKRV